MDEYPFDDLVDNQAPVAFFISTYEGGVPPSNAKEFMSTLEDHIHDHRVPRTLFDRFLSLFSYFRYELCYYWMW